MTLGLQQLADAAVRALSAAVNDPQTAIQAMDVMKLVLVGLAQLDLIGVPHVHDSGGVLRLRAPSCSFVYFAFYAGTHSPVWRTGPHRL